MAAVSKPAESKADATIAPAMVRTQQYTDGVGWELGNAAPEDRYREVGPDGQPTGKASKDAPAGKYATQVAVKGQPVTQAVLDALDK